MNSLLLCLLLFLTERMDVIADVRDTLAKQ